MARFRELSTSEGILSRERTVDSDAPREFRNEVIDLVFSLADQHKGEKYLYEMIAQNIGGFVVGQSQYSYRYLTGKVLEKAEWVRVYDLLPRLADEFRKGGLFEEFRGNLNRILAANGIAWDLDQEGKLVRVLPEEASAAVRVAMQELTYPEFNAANKLLLSAIDAYNAHPQRARDACANAFDAAESIGKVITSLPSGTFGDVIKKLRKDKSLVSPMVVTILENLNTIRGNYFGHGMTTPFALHKEEVDFVYLTCVAAVILFARMRGRISVI